jgi:hypothetical protein
MYEAVRTVTPGPEKIAEANAFASSVGWILIAKESQKNRPQRANHLCEPFILGETKKVESADLVIA